MKHNKLSVFIAGLLLLVSMQVIAHPMPNSLLMLDVKSKNISCELKLPLAELEKAIGQEVNANTETLVARYGAELSEYITSHIQAVSDGGEDWNIHVDKLKVENGSQTNAGIYKELSVRFTMTPPSHLSVRKFRLNYDVILHNVSTHKTLVSIRQDWENGNIENKKSNIGIISYDNVSGTVLPMEIDLDEGSTLKGFGKMIMLGMNHISIGFDHLLFILVLLLSAPLISVNNKWTNEGSLNYSVKRILGLVIAFTIGHVISLLFSVAGWISLPQQPVDFLIVIAILLASVHAIRPVFPGKEIFLVSGFGLIHGLAFATIISDLQLDKGLMFISILGFNLGIELMQLFVILITLPWILMLSKSWIIVPFRLAFSGVAIIASAAWIIERVILESTTISEAMRASANYSMIVLIFIALLAVSSRIYSLWGKHEIA